MAVAAFSTARRCAHPLALRQKLESEIERLIAMLDTLDGDADLEPSLGFSPVYCSAHATDLEFDGSDDEPSLGWITRECGAIVTAGDSDCEVESLPW